MASSTTKTKTIRIANDTADFFEGKALNRLVECVHHLIESGKMTFDGEELKIPSSNSVYTDIDTSSDAYTDLKSMLDCYGLTIEQFILEADRCMNEGLLTFEGDTMLCALPEWAVRLEEACGELGYDVDKIVDSAVKSLKQL